jgi:hypothetical protein
MKKEDVINALNNGKEIYYKDLNVIIYQYKNNYYMYKLRSDNTGITLGMIDFNQDLNWENMKIKD